MGDLSGLISGDNLFKYSFTLGIVMFAFSIIYPMEKRHSLELERVKYREKVALISLDIEILQQKVAKVKSKNKELLQIQKDFHKLSASKKDEIRKEFQIHTSEIDSIDKTTIQVRAKEASLNNLNERIAALEKQTKEFDIITVSMKIVGTMLALFGFIFWSSQTFFNRPPR